MRLSHLSVSLAISLVFGLALSTLAGCSSGDSSDATGPVGGPVAGLQDAHCRGTSGIMVQVTDQNACHPSLDMGVALPDGGAGDPSSDQPDYGTTMYNAQGYDDDCKYFVSFYSTPIRMGQPVTLFVSAHQSSAAVLGANIRAEVFLSDTHPAPNSKTMTVDQGNGSYSIGPVVFDASGQWTVRFHLFEDCVDALPQSPHGHAAFYVNVP